MACLSDSTRPHSTCSSLWNHTLLGGELSRAVNVCVGGCGCVCVSVHMPCCVNPYMYVYSGLQPILQIASHLMGHCYLGDDVCHRIVVYSAHLYPR